MFEIEKFTKHLSKNRYRNGSKIYREIGYCSFDTRDMTIPEINRNIEGFFEATENYCKAHEIACDYTSIGKCSRSAFSGGISTLNIKILVEEN